jgi:hypothetical protein
VAVAVQNGGEGEGEVHILKRTISKLLSQKFSLQSFHIVNNSVTWFISTNYYN